MSSRAAAVILLSALAGQSFAAPVANPYDNGQYVSTGTWNNGQYVSTGTWDDGQYHWTPSSAPAETGAPTAAATTSVDALPTAAASSSVGALPTSIVSPPMSIVSPPVSVVSTSSSASAASSAPGAPGGIFVTSKTPAATTSKVVVSSTEKASSTPQATSSADTSSSTGAAAPALSGRGPAYSGDGSVAAKWPAQSQWISFESMWSLNVKNINSQCTGGIQNSATETQEIHDGIVAASSQYGVPEQFILAVILQESHGCVRVGQTTSPGAAVPNPGIMQDHNGSHNCVGAAVGACSSAEITGMIADGVDGTSEGRGLKQEMAAAPALGGASTAQNVYIAARLYNSGDNSYTKGADLSAGGATSSYPGDIANRMLGYVF